MRARERTKLLDVVILVRLVDALLAPPADKVGVLLGRAVDVKLACAEEAPGASVVGKGSVESARWVSGAGIPRSPGLARLAEPSIVAASAAGLLERPETGRQNKDDD